MNPLDWNDVLHGAGKSALERDALPAYLPRCRWFAGKGRAIESVEIRDHVPAPGGAEWALLFLNVHYAEGASQEYLLPLARLHGQAATQIYWEAPRSILTATAEYAWNGDRTSDITILCEAVHLEDFRLRMLDLMVLGGFWPGRIGALRANPNAKYASRFAAREDRASAATAPMVASRDPATGENLASQVLKAEQSNTAIIFPGRYFVKFLRRLEPGENPEAEILRFLDEHTGFRNAPPFIGSLEYLPAGTVAKLTPATVSSSNAAVTGAAPSGKPYSVAIAEGLVDHEQVAWTRALALARAFCERLAGRATVTAPPADDPALAFARLLGGRTAELHAALASRPDIPAFAPEPFTMDFQKAMHAGMQAEADSVYALLEQAMPRLPEAAAALGRSIQAARPRVLAAFAGLLEKLIPTIKTRVHGDYHLGQVLVTGQDAVILDFEGEPSRSLAERRGKRSPWKDVAGMLRSFHYAAHSAWAEASAELAPEAKNLLQPQVEAWPDKVCAAFLETYSQSAGNAAFMPAPADRDILLRVHLMEKAVYELGYELNNRPDWAYIPMLGILNSL